MNCERCGTESDRLYEVSQRSEFDDELITKKVCWDCDHNVMNGGDLLEDAGFVLMDRWHNDYEFDPINVESPY